MSGERNKLKPQLEKALAESFATPGARSLWMSKFCNALNGVPSQLVRTDHGTVAVVAFLSRNAKQPK